MKRMALAAFALLSLSAGVLAAQQEDNPPPADPAEAQSPPAKSADPADPDASEEPRPGPADETDPADDNPPADLTPLDNANDEPRTHADDPADDMPAEEAADDASRPSLGVYLQETPDGLMVLRVAPDGPAAEAGVQAGDVILRLNGERIEAARELLSALREMREGDRPRLEIFREGWMFRPFVELRTRDRVFAGRRAADAGDEAPRGERRRVLRPLRGGDDDDVRTLRERIDALERDNGTLKKLLESLRGEAAAKDASEATGETKDAASSEAADSLPIPLPPKDVDE